MFHVKLQPVINQFDNRTSFTIQFLPMTYLEPIFVFCAFVVLLGCIAASKIVAAVMVASVLAFWAISKVMR